MKTSSHPSVRFHLPEVSDNSLPAIESEQTTIEGGPEHVQGADASPAEADGGELAFWYGGIAMCLLIGGSVVGLTGPMATICLLTCTALLALAGITIMSNQAMMNMDAMATEFTERAMKSIENDTNVESLPAETQPEIEEEQTEQRHQKPSLRRKLRVMRQTRMRGNTKATNRSDVSSS